MQIDFWMDNLSTVEAGKVSVLASKNSWVTDLRTFFLESKQSYQRSGELALKVGVAGHNFSLLYWFILVTITFIIFSTSEENGVRRKKKLCSYISIMMYYDIPLKAHV